MADCEFKLLSLPSVVNPITSKDHQNSKGLFEWTSVLVIVAHPDDAECCAGGTIAHLTKKGIEVRYLVLTNGDKGTKDPEMTRERLSAIRKSEQNAAANVLGVKSCDFLDLADGEVEDTHEVRGMVTRYIRKYKPDVVMTFNPNTDITMYKHGMEHRDHRTCGQIVLDCCYPLAKNPLYFPSHLKDEGLEPWTVKQAFLFSFHWNISQPLSNVVIDITSTFETKVASVFKHESQFLSGEAARVKEENALHEMGHALASSITSSANSVPSTMKFAEWFVQVLFP